MRLAISTENLYWTSKELYAKVRNWELDTLKKQARITSKGQITVPHEVRRALGVRPGDKLLFEQDGAAFRVRPIRKQSPFEKYRGVGNPGIPSGRKAIIRYFRKMRGK